MSVKVREKKRGSGVWWLFVNHNGKRKSKRIGTDKSEATRLAKILEGRLAAGELGMGDLVRDNDIRPFAFYCHQWLSEVMPANCKASTRADYRSIYRKHLESAPFFNVPVDKITEDDIERFLISKRKVRSWSTCKNIRNAISNTFKRAIKARIVKDNPCDKVKVPQGRKACKKVLAEPYNQVEVEQLLEAFSGHRSYPMILFMVRTGCRSGEVSGLQWGDLDLDLRKANIQRAIVRGKETDTKAGKSRKIDLTPALVSELRVLKIRDQKKGKWVFQNQSGAFVCMDNFRKRVWYPVIEEAELGRVRLHDLRHSFASLVISLTKDIYYAQKMLGHSSITVTCDRYGHLLNVDGENRGVDVLDAPACTLCAPNEKRPYSS
jgi:integrase